MAERPGLDFLGAPERNPLSPAAQPQRSTVLRGQRSVDVQGRLGGFNVAFRGILNGVEGLTRDKIRRQREEDEAKAVAFVESPAWNEALEEYSAQAEGKDEETQKQLFADMTAGLVASGVLPSDPNARIDALARHGANRGFAYGLKMNEITRDPAMTGIESGTNLTTDKALAATNALIEQGRAELAMQASPIVAEAFVTEARKHQRRALDEISKAQQTKAREINQQGLQRELLDGKPESGWVGLKDLSDPELTGFDIDFWKHTAGLVLKEAAASGEDEGMTMALALAEQLEVHLSLGETDRATSLLARAEELKMPTSGILLRDIGGDPGQVMRDMRKALREEVSSEEAEGAQRRQRAASRMSLEVSAYFEDLAKQGLPRNAAEDLGWEWAQENVDPKVFQAMGRAGMSELEIAGVVRAAINRAYDTSDEVTRNEGAAYDRKTADLIATGTEDPDAWDAHLSLAPSGTHRSRALAMRDGSAVRSDVLQKNYTAKQVRDMGNAILDAADGLPRREGEAVRRRINEMLSEAQTGYMALPAVADPDVASTQANDVYTPILEQFRGISEEVQAQVSLSEELIDKGFASAISGNLPELNQFLADSSGLLDADQTRSLLEMRRNIEQQHATILNQGQNQAQNQTGAILNQLATTQDVSPALGLQAEGFVMGEYARLHAEMEAAGASPADIARANPNLVLEAAKAGFEKAGIEVPEFGGQEVHERSAKSALGGALEGDFTIFLPEAHQSIATNFPSREIPEGPISDLYKLTEHAYTGDGDLGLMRQLSIASIGLARLPESQRAAMMAAGLGGTLKLDELMAGQATYELGRATPDRVGDAIERQFPGLLLPSSIEKINRREYEFGTEIQPGVSIVRPGKSLLFELHVGLPDVEVGSLFALHEDDLEALVPRGERREKLRALMGVTNEEFEAAFEAARQLGERLATMN